MAHLVCLCAFSFQRALQFACGNAVVCDTMEEARKVAFGGSERRKVVSVTNLHVHLDTCICMCNPYVYKSYVPESTIVLFMIYMYVHVPSSGGVFGWHSIPEEWCHLWRCC